MAATASLVAFAGILGLLPGRAVANSVCLAGIAAVSSPAERTAGALRFGIYPGGAAGSVADKPDPAPEDSAARLAALQVLRAANGHLGVHIYTAYTGSTAADDGTALWMDGEIAAYTAAGLDVELVVRYKPVGGVAATNAAGFAAFVRATVRRYGGNARFTSMQVTNEANLTGAPDASDGAFAGAVSALVAGVIAAKGEVRAGGYSQVRIGFNWASDASDVGGAGFWRTLGRVGGKPFADAIDWVGLDAYPGTWTPVLDVAAPLLPQLAGQALDSALSTLRGCLMPAAGLGASVPIHVSENGFPTGPGRSETTQAAVLGEMVGAVALSAGTYNVTDYNWFDLRDSRSDDQNFESRYGLLRDDYSPKPAFAAYRALIAEYGPQGGSGAATATAQEPPNAPCVASPVNLRMPRLKGWRLRSLRVMRSGRVIRTVRRASLPAVISLSLPPGTARIAVRLRVSRGSSSRTRLIRSTVSVCAAGLT